MPVSPNIGQTYAEEVAVLYRDAELRILRRIADALAAGIKTADWEAEVLVRAQRAREQVIAELAAVNPQVAAAIQDSIADAYQQGGLGALADIGSLATDLPTTPAPASIEAVRAIAADTAEGLVSVQPAILRRVDDIFREVVADAAGAALAGGDRLETAQAALSRMTARGIDSIPVGRGTMGMTDYLSMAVRTATSRAAIQGTTTTMQRYGINLVTIHPGPRPCDICDRWARAILATDSTPSGLIEVQRVVGDATMRVRVDGSLDDARRAGWGHPNCRCSVAAYLPGITRREDIQRPAWDREGYEAQQRQRQIERQIRGWKTREATALSDGAREDARRRVRAWQAEQRQHLRDHPDLKRQSRREQIGRVI